MKFIFTLFAALAFSAGTMAQNNDWLTISLDSAATIDFPVPPTSMPAVGRTMFTVKNMNHVYTALVTPTTYQNNGNDSGGVQNTYKLFLSGVKMSLPGIELDAQSDFTYRGFPGREFVLSGNMKGIPVWVATRVVIVDGQQFAYVFTTLNTNDLQSPDKDRFFNSLNIGGHATAYALPMAAPGMPKLSISEYLPQIEIFAAITLGIFVFILLAVGLQTLLKRKKA